MIIVKIGGGDKINLRGIIEDLADCDEQFIIVHGANHLRDKIAADLNIEKKVLTSISGYSSVYSDSTALDLLMMAYAGLRNKRVVEICHQNGINAIGLSGLDGKIIQGQRNKGIRVKMNYKVRIVRDFSGKPRQVNSSLLMLLMDNGYVPVLSVPIIDEQNFAINSDNDDIVALLQKTCNARKIIHLIEAPGFLDDPDDESKVVKNITREELKMREKQAEGRMKRKMLAIRKLFEHGTPTVYISDGRTAHPISSALGGEGTIIA